jgi:hypothetical protein
MKCAYCNINSSSNSEHVFPKGLGGENIFMDCVCNECNAKFSGIERELFQKSFVGLMRSTEGLEGYTKNKRRTAPLKFPEIFQYVESDNVVYEVGIYLGFKAYVRPQIILINNAFYSEAASADEINEFIAAFNSWRKGNLTMIVEFPQKKGGSYKAIKYELADKEYKYSEVNFLKAKKEIINYRLMGGSSNEHYSHFDPRLFFDDSQNLIVRSKELEEGINFMKKLLDYCETGSANFKNYSDKPSKDAIKVSFKFDIVKMQRALVKIGLNCLMHYYPNTKYDPHLATAKEYVLFEKEGLKSSVNEKTEMLDTDNRIHHVLFNQQREGLMIRTSLFGGYFVYSFMIEQLALLPNGCITALEVDFGSKKQAFFKEDEFLLKKIADLGWPILDHNDDV